MYPKDSEPRSRNVNNQPVYVIIILIILSLFDQYILKLSITFVSVICTEILQIVGDQRARHVFPVSVSKQSVFSLVRKILILLLSAEVAQNTDFQK